MDRWGRIRAGLSHAFAVGAEREPAAEDLALLGRVADAIARRGMGGPAVLFLETCRPLNYVASQALVFLDPFIRGQAPADYRRLAELLESRATIARLIDAIEARTDPLAGRS